MKEGERRILADLELENTKLKDDNIRLTLQNEEYKKDLIKTVTELTDKRDLVEQYEKAVGLGKA
ncbi:hypothetical protein [Nitrosopumilus sp.]|uniref:hypothetical protein n=1 Tax=Nitrosopumilus sp. TaxID=2024843 RepID=UPI003B5C5D60